MDLEEQRLKQRVDMSEEALKEKVNILKERLEDLKRLTDVKSKVEERPVLTFAGSVLAGLIAGKWIKRKNRHSADAYRAGRRGNQSPLSASAAGGLPDPVTAILSAIATRAAVGILTELAKKVMPHRHDGSRTDRRSHSNN
jgi:hypothetical protein